MLQTNHKFYACIYEFYEAVFRKNLSKNNLTKKKNQKNDFQGRYKWLVPRER